MPSLNLSPLQTCSVSTGGITPQKWRGQPWKIMRSLISSSWDLARKETKEYLQWWGGEIPGWQLTQV